MIGKVEDLINVRSPTSQKVMDGLLGNYFGLIGEIIEQEVDLAAVLDTSKVEAPTGFHNWESWEECRRHVKKLETEGIRFIVDGNSAEERGAATNGVAFDAMQVELEAQPPSLKRGGFSGATAPKIRGKDREGGLDKRVITAFEMADVDLLLHIATPEVRDSLVSKGMSKNLWRSIANLIDVWAMLRKREGTIFFGIEIAREADAVASTLVNWHKQRMKDGHYERGWKVKT